MSVIKVIKDTEALSLVTELMLAWRVAQEKLIVGMCVDKIPETSAEGMRLKFTVLSLV